MEYVVCLGMHEIMTVACLRRESDVLNWFHHTKISKNPIHERGVQEKMAPDSHFNRGVYGLLFASIDLTSVGIITDIDFGYCVLIIISVCLRQYRNALLVYYYFIGVN